MLQASQEISAAVQSLPNEPEVPDWVRNRISKLIQRASQKGERNTIVSLSWSWWPFPAPVEHGTPMYNALKKELTTIGYTWEDSTYNHYVGCQIGPYIHW
jgi:hypothetical protein